jgi:protein O-GlcNAc transferase
LREVPNSILCLLENPQKGTAYLRKFVHEAAGTIDKSKTDAGADPYEAFVPGDGDELNSRIHFLPWEKNPFAHQRRNLYFCNAMLDSSPYNGHTVAQDSLYAGVPIVTRSDGLDMSSRVTTSANLVLGLGHLNAWKGQKQYENISIELATNTSLYKKTRSKLIDSCLQRNPMHPYWDVPRYVKNFEQGLQQAWGRFLNGDKPAHIVIEETPEAQAGTYNDEILAHPPQGPNAVLQE